MLLAVSKSSKVLLDKVEQIYRAAVSNYRDEMLRVGQLLHDYILASAEEAGPLSFKGRLKVGACREFWTKAAATRLGASPDWINKAIRASAAVSLVLGDDPDLGSISYATVRVMGAVVVRPSGHIQRDPNYLADGEITFAEKETWEFHPALGEAKAKALYTRCIREGWGRNKASDEVRELSRKRGRTKKSGDVLSVSDCGKLPSIFGIQEIARKASPRDLAEIILSLIDASQDAQAVERAILSGLKTERPKPAATLSWDD